MTRILLERGADRTIKDKYGAIALDMICSCEAAGGKNSAPCPVGGCDRPKTKTKLADLLV